MFLLTVCMWSWLSSSITFCFIFWTWRSHICEETGLPASFDDSRVSTSPELRLQLCTEIPGFWFCFLHTCWRFQLRLCLNGKHFWLQPSPLPQLFSIQHSVNSLCLITFVPMDRMVLPCFPHYERLKSPDPGARINLCSINLFLSGTLVTTMKVTNMGTFPFGLPQIRISH